MTPGVIFGFRLMFPRIFYPQTITSFFLRGPIWSPPILFIIFRISLKPVICIFLGQQLNSNLKTISSIKTDIILDQSTLIGAILFGVGWGIRGLYVRTGIINVAFVG